MHFYISHMSKTVTHFESLEISVRCCTLIFLLSTTEISEASEPGITPSVEMVKGLGIMSPILPYEGQDNGRQKDNKKNVA